MKKLVLIVLALGLFSGSAFADRGFWYTSNTTASWNTFFNIHNSHATNTVTATVKIYAGTQTGTPFPTLIGSTTRTMGPLAYWNFGTDAAVDTTSLTTNTFNANTRGTVIITSSDSSSIIGYTTIMDGSKSSGFNFRMPVTE